MGHRHNVLTDDVFKINVNNISRIDEEIVTIPVIFNALVLSFIIINKILVSINIKRYIKYNFIRYLLALIHLYHICILIHL